MELLLFVLKIGFLIWMIWFISIGLKKWKIVPGGETGQLSIYHGLCAAKEISGDEKSIVLIHDGVRPLIDKN